MYNTLTILRKKNAAEILVNLLKGAKGIREIQMTVGGSYKTIYARIKEFFENDLVTDKYITGEIFGIKPYDIRLIQLTEKGRDVAQSLVDSDLLKPLKLSKFRERWIIVILSILKTVSGTTRFMKLLFLVKKELGLNPKKDLAGFYRFRAGKYGPFSRAVMNDLEELQDDGFIKVQVKKFPKSEFNEEQKSLIIYELSAEHPEVVQEAIELLPPSAIKKLDKLKIFNKMPLIKLLEHVYNNYPDYIKKSVIVKKVLHSQ